MKIRIVLGLFAIATLLNSCTQVQPLFVDSQPTQAAINGYPALEENPAAGGYPADGMPESASSGMQITAYPEGELPPIAETVSDPQDGKASISGVLFSMTNRSVIPGTKIYLVKAVGDNLDEVPPVLLGPGANDSILQSDDSGMFSTDSLDPGNYFLVMSAPPYDWEVGQKDSEGTPYLIDIKAGDQLNLGVIYIFWP